MDIITGPGKYKRRNGDIVDVIPRSPMDETNDHKWTTYENGRTTFVYRSDGTGACMDSPYEIISRIPDEPVEPECEECGGTGETIRGCGDGGVHHEITETCTNCDGTGKIQKPIQSIEPEWKAGDECEWTPSNSPNAPNMRGEVVSVRGRMVFVAPENEKLDPFAMAVARLRRPVKRREWTGQLAHAVGGIELRIPCPLGTVDADAHRYMHIACTALNNAESDSERRAQGGGK